MMVLKRVYDHDAMLAKFKVLVDRIWPRGINKKELDLDEWYKEVAPSTPLRKWFNHDPHKWEAFKKKYKSELTDKQDILKKIRQLEGSIKK